MCKITGFLMLCCVSISTATTIDISREVIQTDSMRIGVNLPGPNAYGAENYARNVIPNPGFEPAYWGSVVTLNAITSSSKVQAAYWNTLWHNNNEGWRIDHWTGAEWELPLQGLSGIVTAFTHDDNRYTFTLDRSVTVAYHEPLLVRTQEKTNGNEPYEGLQSRKITSPGNAYQTVGSIILDTLAKQGQENSGCGMLRTLEGEHTLSFYAKGDASVEIVIERYPGYTLFTQTFQLNNEWRKYEATFDPKDSYKSGESPMLSIGWKFKSGKSFLLDSMYLGEKRTDQITLRFVDGNAVVVPSEPFFDSRVETALEFLQPGVLRGWSGSHGDPLENLLQESQYLRAPREFRIRIANAGQSISYAIPDLLRLCRDVGALPWIVLPPTLTDAEMVRLGDWLRNNAADFEKVWVEFSNEAWGTNNPGAPDPFAGSSFDGGVRLGKVAHKKFAAMGDISNVQKVIGGQHAWSGQNHDIRQSSSPAYMIPTAPYFGVLNQQWATPEEMFYPLYAKAYEEVSPIGKAYANKDIAQGIYEINFHTTNGAGGNKAIVNKFVASQAGGIALPLFCLTYAREFGWQPQAVFTLAQYAAGGVRIWGTFRDVAATGRPRPTGVSTALVNRAIVGNMVTVNVEGAPPLHSEAVNKLEAARDFPSVEAFAWRNGNEWSAALFNLSMGVQAEVELTGVGPVDSCEFVFTEDPLATNEDADNVTIDTKAWDGILLPHSLTVLRGSGPEKIYFEGGRSVSPYDEQDANTVIHLR